MTSWERLRNQLVKRNKEEQGFQQFLAEKMDVTVQAVQKYIYGTRTPGLDQADKLAKALSGKDLWEVIKPEGAKPTKTPTEIELLEMLQTRDKQIAKMEAKYLKVKDADLLDRIISIWGTLEDHQRKDIADEAERRSAGLGQGGVSPKHPVSKKRETK